MRVFPLIMLWSAGVATGSMLETGFQGVGSVGVLLGVGVCTWAGVHSQASEARRTRRLEHEVAVHKEAEKIRKNTKPFTKWSEIADRFTQRFHVAAALGYDTVHNPEGAAAIRKIAMEMGKRLDHAVDNCWAQAPSAEVIKRAQNLGAKSAASKQLPPPKPSAKPEDDWA